VVARASWPDELVLRETLGSVAQAVRDAGIRRTATILVGPALAAEGFRDSHLYSSERERPGALSRPASDGEAGTCP
jgi:precorrin-4/cobalt-precorrin-4 C11-methyltransferase